MITDTQRLDLIEKKYREDGECPITEHEGWFYFTGMPNGKLRCSLRQAIDAVIEADVEAKP